MGFTKKVRDWAERRGQWFMDAEHKDNRMGITTQSHLPTRLKGFFAWATNSHLIDFDLSAARSTSWQATSAPTAVAPLPLSSHRIVRHSGGTVSMLRSILVSNREAHA